MDDFHSENFVERCLTGNAQAFEPLVRHYQNEGNVASDHTQRVIIQNEVC